MERRASALTWATGLVLSASSCGVRELPAPKPDRAEPVLLHDPSGDPEGPATRPSTTLGADPDTATPGPAPGTTRRKELETEPGRGRLIDLDVVRADIHDVCRLLADVGRTNIVVADDVAGTVTVKMQKVPWDRALSAILASKGWRSKTEGNVIIVSAR